MDAAAGVRTLSAREEEMLGLLAGFPDDGSSRELSFSDLVDAGFRPTSAHRHDTAPGKQEAAASKQQQQREQAAAREKRQRRQRSGGGSNRGSCGSGGDGVLLNFYVPGLLTRSMTAPRLGRGALPHGAPAKAAAAAAVAAAGPGKARTRAPLGIGCWPALWGRSRDHRSTAKVCS